VCEEGNGNRVAERGDVYMMGFLDCWVLVESAWNKFGATKALDKELRLIKLKVFEKRVSELTTRYGLLD